ncbi:MAG: TldD/PmbA family protein [Dehalococcoidia bacterium]|nr:TldD/PmbA family protein [Dehalococcoidia bacterium]
MPQEILHRALKVAEQSEVFSISSRGTSVIFEANELKQIETKESSSIALRIFKDGRVGFATASGVDDIETLLDMAVETSQFGNPAKFQFSPFGAYPQVSTFDSDVEETPMEQMLETGKELVAKVTSHTPDISCDVEVARGTSSMRIVNSQGGEAGYDKSFFTLSMEGIVVEDTDMLFVGDSESSCRLLSGIGDLADRVIRQLEMAERKAVVSTKLLPVIFTPHGVASCLLTPIALAFNGKTIIEGASKLSDRLGEQVFDRRLSLWDDATIAYGVGSYPCDDEGTPSHRLPLIAGGKVSNFLYDLQTAVLGGTRSTGNGRRMGNSPPRPAISSLIIGVGELSFTDMVKDVKEGLIVEQLIGADQGNLLAGDFGGNVLLGYKVENGEIVGRVKDVMISGNIYEVLRELLGIGREPRWVEGILQTPPLYCPRVSVATKDR